MISAPTETNMLPRRGTDYLEPARNYKIMWLPGPVDGKTQEIQTWKKGLTIAEAVANFRWCRAHSPTAVVVWLVQEGQPDCIMAYQRTIPYNPDPDVNN